MWTKGDSKVAAMSHPTAEQDDGVQSLGGGFETSVWFCFFSGDVMMVRNWWTISPPHMIGGFLYFLAVCECVSVCVCVSKSSVLPSL